MKDSTKGVIGLRKILVTMIVLHPLLVAGCESSSGSPGEYPYGHYEDDQMIGIVWDVYEAAVVVDISEWEKRDRKGPAMTDEGYSYAATITEDTVIKLENGTEVTFSDIKKGQKVQINPPRGSSFEVVD